MSFILNALRKSEQERQMLKAETVTDRIVINPLQPHKNKSFQFYVLLIIGNVLLIVGGVAGLRYYTAPTLQVAPNSPLTQKSVPIPPALPDTLTQTVPHEKTAIKTHVNTQKPTVESLPAKTPIKKISSVPLELPDYPEKIDSSTENSPALVQTNELNTAPPTTLPNNKDLPFLSDLPLAFRRSVPKFTVNVFVHAEQAEESFVIIDMHKYKAGQSIQEGMVLKAILPDSLLIEYQNQTFQIERP